MSQKPHFGWTRHGLAVHAATADHHQAGAFNKAIAQALTKYVGSMACFWVFNVLALLSLPATFHLMGLRFITQIGIPAFFLSYGWIFLVAWVCQNFIQLVLLPAIMVGQSLQSAAADARAAKQFEDTELIADRLDETTQGGLRTIVDMLRRMDAHDSLLLDEIHRHVTALAPGAGDFPPPPEAPGTQPPPASRKLQRPPTRIPLPPDRPGGDRM